MGRIEKAWWSLISQFPFLAPVKIQLKGIPRNLSIEETKAVLMQRIQAQK